MKANWFYFSCHLQMLLTVFSIIRRKFWDYGRLALVADNQGLVHDLTHLSWQASRNILPRTHFRCEILTRIMKLIFFLSIWFCPWHWTLCIRFTESTHRRYGHMSSVMSSVDDTENELVWKRKSLPSVSAPKSVLTKHERIALLTKMSSHFIYITHKIS